MGSPAARGPAVALTLVLDASAVVPECTAETPFAARSSEELVAPPLMWSEARSVLHRSVARGVIDRALGLAALRMLEGAPVRRRSPVKLGLETWRIAEDLGWHKTYDAEYLALASLLGCRLVTFDARIRRGAERLGVYLDPPGVDDVSSG